MAFPSKDLSEYRFIVFGKAMDELFARLTNVNFLIEPEKHVSGENLATSLQSKMRNYGTLNTYRTIAAGDFKNMLEDLDRSVWIWRISVSYDRTEEK